MYMVTAEEITRMAAMMRITIDDEAEYIEKVQSILAYFDILDSAGVDDETVQIQDADYTQLRQDEHHPYDMDMRGPVRAPGLG